MTVKEVEIVLMHINGTLNNAMSKIVGRKLAC